MSRRTSAIPASKSCAVCGRAIEWRKKWARDWEHVRYCSNACRRSKSDPDHARLEGSILDLLRRRGHASSICPSEAARAIGAEDWRSLMESARQAARRLADRGLITITQRGRAVDPTAFRGPIRLQLTASGRQRKD